MPQGQYRLSDIQQQGSAAPPTPTGTGAFKLTDIQPADTKTDAAPAAPAQPTALDKAKRAAGNAILQNFGIGPDDRMADTIGDVAIGALKGAGATVSHLGELAVNAGMVPGVQPAPFNPAWRSPIFQKTDDLTTATNTAQKVGKAGETVAELAAPAVDVAKAGIAGVRALTGGADLGGAAFDAATHLIPGGRYLRGARQLLGAALDTAPTTTPSASNAGGKLVPKAGPSFSDQLSSILEDLRKPEPPGTVSLPPQAQLPPGYTPRASVGPAVRLVPKAAAVPSPSGAAAVEAAAPAATPAEAAAPSSSPARLYFLKSPEQMAQEASSGPRAMPKGSITVEDLPASWKPRTGQDLFPLTGADGASVKSEMLQEIKDRGLSLGEAISLISRNPDVSTQLRTQMIRALTQGSGQ